MENIFEAMYENIACMDYKNDVILLIVVKCILMIIFVNKIPLYDKNISLMVV